FADLDAVDARKRDDVAGLHLFGFVAIEAAKRKELGDFCGLQLAIEFADTDFSSALQCAVKDARNGYAAQKFAVIEIHHLQLQSCGGIAGRRGNSLHDGFKQWKQILGIIALFAMSDAVTCVGINDREIELVFGSVEINEEIRSEERRVGKEGG